ncbi:MAG TPA: hypothetical protein VGK99_10955 [Acidobacteriota bacterium]|jgi:hypothetical protein
MNSSKENHDGVLFIGLDGGNPLAFLASLGTLRLLSLSLPEHRVVMCWQPHRGAWRPRMILEPEISSNELLDEVATACRYGAFRGRRQEAKQWEAKFIAACAQQGNDEREREKTLKKQRLSGQRLRERLPEQILSFEVAIEEARLGLLQIACPHLLIADDLTLSAPDFAHFAATASQAASHDDRSIADFAAAFGCEAVTDEAGRIQDTGLRTMAGAGHQHFLAFMRNIVLATTANHLEKALFSLWCYDDPVENLTLRWDPIDDVRYALRWRNPSGDPVRKKQGTVLGANRLAIEGIPLLPTAPQASFVATTGFRGRKSFDTYWTWPIWSEPATLDVVRTLLAHQELQEDSPNRRLLSAVGVAEVYRSRRITIGKVRNFSPATSPG